MLKYSTIIIIIESKRESQLVPIRIILGDLWSIKRVLWLEILDERKGNDAQRTPIPKIHINVSIIVIFYEVLIWRNDKGLLRGGGIKLKIKIRNGSIGEY